MTFKTDYDELKKEIRKPIGKNKAYEKIQSIIEILSDSEYIHGSLPSMLVELESFFTPALRKTEPFEFCLRALLKKENKNKKYVNYGHVTKYGFCCTDSVRLHLLKGFQNNDKFFNPISRHFFSDDKIIKDIEYPGIESLLKIENGVKVSIDDFEVVDKDTIQVNLPGGKSNLFNRKFMTDLINGVKNPEITMDQDVRIMFENEIVMGTLMIIRK